MTMISTDSRPIATRCFSSPMQTGSHIARGLRSTLGRWLTVLALAYGSASAADLQVRVTHKSSGAALAGAAVCLGTGADSQQFGVFLTDADGRALFKEIPPIPVVLTVSKPGFRGYQQLQGDADFDRVVVVALPAGGLGPACEISPQQAARQRGADAGIRLKINGFRIDRDHSRTDGRVVTLSSEVGGRPTHYRASESADFEDAQWQRFRTNPSFELSAGGGTKTIYYQVRRHHEIDGASLQAVSDIAQDSIDLR